MSAFAITTFLTLHKHSEQYVLETMLTKCHHRKKSLALFFDLLCGELDQKRYIPNQVYISK